MIPRTKIIWMSRLCLPASDTVVTVTLSQASLDGLQTSHALCHTIINQLTPGQIVSTWVLDFLSGIKLKCRLLNARST